MENITKNQHVFIVAFAIVDDFSVRVYDMIR